MTSSTGRVMGVEDKSLVEGALPEESEILVPIRDKNI
jgi:hypothetical protein